MRLITKAAKQNNTMADLVDIIDLPQQQNQGDVETLVFYQREKKPSRQGEVEALFGNEHLVFFVCQKIQKQGSLKL